MSDFNNMIRQRIDKAALDHFNNSKELATPLRYDDFKVGFLAGMQTQLDIVNNVIHGDN